MKVGDRYHIYYISGKYEFHALPPVLKSLATTMADFFWRRKALRGMAKDWMPSADYYKPIFDADQKAYRGAVRVKEIRGYVLEVNFK